jgi:hypothetical protein
MIGKIRFQAVLPIGNVVLFAASIIELVTQMNGGSLLGICAGLLTLPWDSLIAILVSVAPPTTGVVIMLLCAGLNACCLYAFGTWID